MKKTYNIDLPTGEKVKVDYNSRAFSEDSVCPHLEFHGKAISETGYRSHFFGDVIGGYEPTFEEVEKLIYKLIEEWTTIRFDKPTQVKLFP
jgi:hypothetical protein